LASAAGLAIAGVSWDAKAQTANVNATGQSGVASFFTLMNGD
jgi:hypothetical protein